MIFIGDIALPYPNSVQVKGFPLELNWKNWFGNLEGAIVDNIENLQKQHVVFNDREAVRRLIKEFNFVGFATANNHIFDTGSIDYTIVFFKEINIPYVGIGNDLTEAAKPLILNEGGREIILLNFGWEVIQCELAMVKGPGVNPLVKGHVLKTVEKAINTFPNGLVIPFMHWSYELEDTPQPMERELAKKLIEMGAAGVIGCHPHRIGGFEMYKNKPIVYSLGNWMFKQNFYFDGKLKFPNFCNLELAFEWDFENDDLKFHFFQFDNMNSILTFSHTEGIDSETMNSYTPFRGLSNEEYKIWYKNNHYHKKKGLPIYYWEDNSMEIYFKNKFNKSRAFFVELVSRFR